MTFPMLQTINIVTTAAYPWRTGLSILPLLRAYYLAQRGLDVTLYVPWIAPEDQLELFGTGTCFTSPETQEAHIRAYLPGPDQPSLKIEFYPGVYVKLFGSIIPTCRLSKRIRACDWLLLEEPEHLNWFQPMNRFRKCAPRVTGNVLTNYFYYWSGGLPGLPILPWLMERYSRLLIRHHCDDVLILSNQMGYLKGSVLMYSSGIHPSFFQTPPPDPASQKAYFIGKLLWGKGFREMVNLLSGSPVRKVDVFGGGDDRDAIAAYAESKGIRFRFKGITTDPAGDLKDYKIFLNMSRSENSCTTTAEALGMGKFVIVPKIPSNDRYYKYRNCLSYTSPREFRQWLDHALAHAPKKDVAIYDLSWDTAVDRLLQYYYDTENKRPSSRRRTGSRR